VLNPDFRDMLSALYEEGVEFLVVGAYAMAAHGVTRATGDLDFWVHPSESNAQRLIRALNRFGAPTDSITAADFASPDLVFQIGIEPNRIDLLTSIDGVDFQRAWRNRITEPDCAPHAPRETAPCSATSSIPWSRRASGSMLRRESAQG
jgi:hypothetical protein